MFIIFTDLHIRCAEVDLAELEDEQVPAVLPHRNVVPEGVGVVALRLVEDLIRGRDASYRELATVVRLRAGTVGVLRIPLMEIYTTFKIGRERVASVGMCNNVVFVCRS